MRRDHKLILLARRKRAFFMKGRNMNPFNFADGYKTYFVALTIVMIGVGEGVLGVDIPGVEVGDDWMAYIVGGLGLGSFRSMVQKVIDGLLGN